MKLPLRVMKVGGSLLTYPELGQRLRSCLEQAEPAATLICVGGGGLADVIREADRLHQLGDEACHWACIQLMDVAARLLASMLPGARLIGGDELISSGWRQPGIFGVALVEDFLKSREGRGAVADLPHDWRTTSDSIAAVLATETNAGELILLKSCDLPPGMTREAAAAAGLTDPVFPTAAMGLDVNWTNLRGSFWEQRQQI